MSASRPTTATRMTGTAATVARSAPRVTHVAPPARDYPWAVYLVIAVVCFGLTVFASTDYVRTMFERMFQ